jgi:voltage-gated potassium channel
MSGKNAKQPEEVGFFQLVVLILSVVVLAALFVDTACKLPPQVSQVLDLIDTCVCMLLLADVGIRFYKAESKLEFMKWGWIDLLASIPNLPFLRIGRLVRILRLLRLLRAIRTTHRLSHLFLHHKLRGGIASVFLTFVLLVLFASVGILVCEGQDPDAKIKTGEDAIWWSVATITTVGYGDLYPVTTEGRLLAMVLMVAGVGIFGAVSGVVALALLGDQKKDDEGEGQAEILERLKRLEEKLDRLAPAERRAESNARKDPPVGATR